MVVRRAIFAAAVLVAVAALPWWSTPAAAPAERARAAVAAVCPGPAPALNAMKAAMGATDAAEEPVDMRGRPVGWRRRFTFDGGARLEVERFAPGGFLQRINVIQHASVGGEARPTFLAMAVGDCRIVEGRRIVRDADGIALEIEVLGPDLEQVRGREPLNPPLPAPTARGAEAGVRVAMVDAGVNYTLPAIVAGLARDPAGRVLGYDFWDMDRRPFDANPAPSPFFVRRHGTRTASVLLREAPGARLVPYRYPRPDMARMAELIEQAAGLGVVVVAMPLGSNRKDLWGAFAAAAARHPEMLFVVSAGNNGRDIDARPVYPAALPLENMITVTSAAADGRLARGSNWGRSAVDLLVPAENVPVIDFRGRSARSSGSSFAVPRVTALAARLLAAHPDWRGPALKAAIYARAVASPETKRVVAVGLIADPAADPPAGAPRRGD